jgi:hypothetical protein
MHAYTPPSIAAPGVSCAASSDLSPPDREGGGVGNSSMDCAERIYVPIPDFFLS